MMDLLVQVAARNKLSPAGHTLYAVNEETGRPIQYQASQAVGTLGVSEIHLVNKKSLQHNKPQQVPKHAQPFQVTEGNYFID